MRQQFVFLFRLMNWFPIRYPVYFRCQFQCFNGQCHFTQGNMETAHKQNWKLNNFLNYARRFYHYLFFVMEDNKKMVKNTCWNRRRAFRVTKKKLTRLNVCLFASFYFFIIRFSRLLLSNAEATHVSSVRRLPANTVVRANFKVFHRSQT